jgi:hypothetical protein
VGSDLYFIGGRIDRCPDSVDGTKKGATKIKRRSADVMSDRGKTLPEGMEGTRMETNTVSMKEGPQGPRVVIIGGGFGGLHAAKALANEAVEVTLIDGKNHHTFQPLLYQVALGVLSPGEITGCLRHILRKSRGDESVGMGVFDDPWKEQRYAGD